MFEWAKVGGELVVWRLEKLVRWSVNSVWICLFMLSLGKRRRKLFKWFSEDCVALCVCFPHKSLIFLFALRKKKTAAKPFELFQKYSWCNIYIIISVLYILLHGAVGLCTFLGRDRSSFIFIFIFYMFWYHLISLFFFCVCVFVYFFSVSFTPNHTPSRLIIYYIFFLTHKKKTISRKRLIS